MRKTGVILSILIFFINCHNKQKENAVSKSYSILENASIEILDASVLNIIDSIAAIEIIATGHEWTEGPLWVEKINSLIYSDIPRNAIYSWNDTNGVKKYLNHSGYLGKEVYSKEPGSNGLILDIHGNLIVCQHGERQIAKMNTSVSNASASFTPLVNSYNGQKFNSPNDLVYDTKGNLYFTDPPYGLPKRMKSTIKEISFQGVYKLDTNNQLTLIDSTLSRPNGIALSPDEKTLYVANSDPENALWTAYTIEKNSEVKNKRTFYNVSYLIGKEKGLPDGMKVHKNGTIFASGPGGIFLISSDGKHLGTIKTGQATSNCAFNNDYSTLYITADSYVLRVQLKN